jgi:pentatricopeptide repeat protein
MEKWCILPDGFMFESLIKGHCKICNVEAALTLFHEMERRGIVATLFCYTNLINGLCSKGRLEEASKLVEEMLERDLLLGINADSRLHSEYCRRFDSLGTDKLFDGSELDVSFVDFIGSLNVIGWSLKKNTGDMSLTILFASSLSWSVPSVSPSPGRCPPRAPSTGRCPQSLPLLAGALRELPLLADALRKLPQSLPLLVGALRELPLLADALSLSLSWCPSELSPCSLRKLSPWARVSLKGHG